jgi:hypothetical protein
MCRLPTLLLLVAGLLAGCGGGGSSRGGEVQEQVQSFNLGIVRADQPTTVTISVEKPLYSAHTVELAEAPVGAFRVAYALPIELADGHEASLPVTFTPTGAPVGTPQQGTIRLLFRGAGADEALPVTLELRAQTEAPSVRLLQTEASAGSAAVGETVRFGVYLENRSVATPITVTGVTPPSGEFALAPDAFAAPFPVGPGSKLLIPMLYAPQGEWNASSLLRVRHSADGATLEATVTGTGIAPLVFSDYGYVALDPVTFESDWLTLDVPAEGVGIFVEAWGDPSASLIDLIGFEGPSGIVYASYDLAGPLDWLANYPAGARGYLNVELPGSDLPAAQLARGGGSYRFRLRDSAFATDRLQVRVTVSQRAAGIVQEGTLDLRVFLADGLAIDRSDPMSNGKLATAMKAIDAILGMNAIRLGTISFSFMDPAYNILADETEMQNLFAAHTAGLAEGPLNLFFVSDMPFPTAEISGVAGAVPGPRSNGTPYSGVVVGYERADGITVGAKAVHQMVHYLGGPGANTVLPLASDAYRVLRHPLLNPGLPRDLLSPPETTGYAEILAMIDLMPPMDAWCGTCTRPPLR